MRHTRTCEDYFLQQCLCFALCLSLSYEIDALLAEVQYQATHTSIVLGTIIITSSNSLTVFPYGLEEINFAIATLSRLCLHDWLDTCWKPPDSFEKTV